MLYILLQTGIRFSISDIIDKYQYHVETFFARRKSIVEKNCYPLKMYERGKEVSLESSVGLMVKNLQVVSFDSEWLEIYLGTVSLYNHNHKQVVR